MCKVPVEHISLRDDKKKVSNQYYEQPQVLGSTSPFWIKPTSHQNIELLTLNRFPIDTETYKARQKNDEIYSSYVQSG